MQFRSAASAALLAALALGTAACDPDDAGGTAAPAATSAAASPAGSASATAAAKPSGKPAGKASAPAPTESRPDCKTYFASHKVIHVLTVDAGLRKLVANPVEANCTDDGVFFNPAETKVTYTVSPDAQIATYTDMYGNRKTVVAKSGTATDGMAHVKRCAETDHMVNPDALPAGWFCYQEMYEVVVDGKGVVTSLKETYSS